MDKFFPKDLVQYLWEKYKAYVAQYVSEHPVSGPQGEPGPDGSPIGTILAYMGTAAPKDYLVCDGAVHDILAYPNLASHINTEFGSVNFFGGDGTTTFAVPDLRNLFLRGYHGNSEEQLSTNIGERQSATTHPAVGLSLQDANSIAAYGISGEHIQAGNADTSYPPADTYAYSTINQKGTTVAGEAARFTSRPVNMAVLYCIKAVGGGACD